MQIKIPQTRIKWICIVISLYFLWGIYDEVWVAGMKNHKACVGSIIGFVAFLVIGLSPDNRKPPSDPEKSDQ